MVFYDSYFHQASLLTLHEAMISDVITRIAMKFGTHECNFKFGYALVLIYNAFSNKFSWNLIDILLLLFILSDVANTI
jgi:hypothetical protein